MMRSHADGESPVPAARHRIAISGVQHSSHLDLVARNVSAPAGTEVDAIVVPSARDSSFLQAAVGLAADLACPLLILASRRATAAGARSVARPYGVEPLAIDVTTTTSLIGLETHSGPYTRDSDTSLKRNLALAVARMTGWQRVLFLDDDVTGVEPAEVRTAAALIGRYRAVGLENVGWYDNSVVCHANRDTGGKQECFVGAGGLLVNATETRSFFPNIYNEDWFFLLDDDGLAEVAMSGHCAQATFDPYADPARARLEEFGDCLAEGLFALLDEGADLDEADDVYWRHFLDQRRTLIDAISVRARTMPDPLRAGVLRSMTAARTALARIAPEECVAYIDLWRQDRVTWQAWTGALPQNLSPAAALRHLGLNN